MTLPGKLPDVGLTLFSAMPPLGDHRLLGFWFAKNDATLKEAAEKLCRS